MTEDEAKTKWCPMVRAVYHFDGLSDHVVASGNRTARGEPPIVSLCLASGCMMWRSRAVGVAESLKPHDAQIRTGWCGLTGDRH